VAASAAPHSKSLPCWKALLQRQERGFVFIQFTLAELKRVYFSPGMGGWKEPKTGKLKSVLQSIIDTVGLGVWRCGNIRNVGVAKYSRFLTRYRSPLLLCRQIKLCGLGLVSTEFDNQLQKVLWGYASTLNFSWSLKSQGEDMAYKRPKMKGGSPFFRFFLWGFAHTHSADLW